MIPPDVKYLYMMMIVMKWFVVLLKTTYFKNRIMLKSNNFKRVLSFGKYKGSEVKYIILTHIGYIMWCLENIPQFKLNSEEQKLYDGVAILIKKSNMDVSFPVSLMYKYVIDKKALESLETPFTLYNGNICLKSEYFYTPIHRSIEEYAKERIKPVYNDLSPLSASMKHDVEIAHLNGESFEDIFGGWGNINCYKDC